jgi:glucose/arabinose dehydrogenase
MQEYWTIGHRSPHRITVDRATGRIWSGEPGESLTEEINVIEGGGNYGWPYLEGNTPGPHSPVPPTITGILTPPVIDFARSEAWAIIGGYVYRGTTFPELTGRYIAGDYVTLNVWAIDLDPVTMTATKELITTFHPGGLATFGQDNDGEILMGSVSLDVPPSARTTTARS